MIVAALLEFAIVLILKHHPRNADLQLQANKNDTNLIERSSNARSSYQKNDRGTDNKEAWVTKQNDQPKKPLHEKLDYACFLLFPIIYMLFNVIYFSVYILL